MTGVPATHIAIPFQGLRYFDEDRADLFFGRDDQIHELLGKLGQSRFVTVIGSSGSGKSSLVRAGLLPALRSGLLRGVPPRWRVVKCAPGETPIRALARAMQEVFGVPGLELTLRRGPLGLVEAAAQCGLPETENLLVFVDQFEEIFRYERVAKHTAEARQEAAAFVKLLLEAAQAESSSIYVLLTMRSDYLGSASNFRDLPERINRGLYLVPRMTRDQIEESIRGPIALCDAHISAPLAQRLLNDLGDSTDQLPVLQHAMLRTWVRWQGENRPQDPIDLRHYEQAGGLKRGLSNHANEIYDSLSPEHQAVCEALFRCLTERDPGERDIRRPTEIAVVARVAGVHPDRVREVADLFRANGTTFLMPPSAVALDDASKLDITHESLIRNWDKLSGTAEQKGWVQDEADLLDQYHDLAKRARRKQTAEDLLRGGDLATAIAWRTRHRGPGWAERYDGDTTTYASVISYIADSESRRRADEEQFALAAESARREQQKKRMRRIFWAVGGVVAFLLIALAASLLKSSSRDRNVALQTAKEQASRAETETDLRGQADVQSRDAVRQRNEAGTRELTAHATETLLEDPEVSRLLALHAVDRALRYAPEALPAAENALHAAILAPVAKFTFRHGGAVRALAFSRDGATLATGSDDNTVKLWNTHSGKPLLTLRDKDMRGVLAVAFQPVERRVVAAGADSRVSMWDASTGKTITGNALAPLGGSLDTRERVTAAAFSPDGRLIATVGIRGTVTLIDTTADARNLRHPDCGGPCLALALAFSPDSRRLAVGEGRGDVRFWDTSADGELIGSRIPRFADAIASIAYSPDGSRLAIVGGTGATIWDLEYEKELGSMHGGQATSVAVGPDTVVTGSSDGTVRIWDLRAGRVRPWAGNGGSLNSVAISPDGKLLATASTDGTARLYDVASPQAQEVLKLHGSGGAVETLAFSPDDKLLLGARDYFGVDIWDANSGRKLRTLPYYRSARFSPDGKVLAVGTGEQAEFWNLSSGKRVGGSMFKDIFADLGGEILAFNPDLTRFVAKSHPSQPVAVWNASSPMMAKRLWPLPDSSISVAAYSPDGNQLVTGSPDGKVSLWDVASQRKLLTVHSGRSAPNALSFSPDGQHFATAGDEGTAQLFDTRSGREEVTFRGHNDRVLSLAFTPDGTRLATGSYDRTLKVWDAASGQELLTLRGQQSGVWGVAYTHDGKRLAAASEDGTIQIYAVGTTEIFNLVRSRIHRNLTSQECAKYLHTAPCPPLPLPRP